MRRSRFTKEQQEEMRRLTRELYERFYMTKPGAEDPEQTSLPFQKNDKPKPQPKIRRKR